MMSAVSSVWMYLLVTEPLAWPTSAAIVTSVKPRSLAMLAKLWRRTWGVTSDSGESSKRCFQWLGKLPNAFLALSREDVCADIVGAPPLKILDDRQANGANGFSFLTVLQSQTARLGVSLRPFQADPLASPAAGQRKLANDVHDRSVFLLLGGVSEHPTQYSILRLRESTLSYIVLWLANAMGWVALDDARLDRVGENAAKETHGARGR